MCRISKYRLQRCLNPRKAHENRVLAQSEDATVALPDLANGQASSQQVACQYCKYLLEGALLGDCRIIKWVGSDDFRLDVAQSTQTPTPTPQKFHFPRFNAQAAPSTNAPTTLRSGHSMVWDAKDNLLLVFGGVDNQGNLLNDLWSYSPTTGNWTEINNVSQTGNCGSLPSPRMNAAMVWDSVNNQVLLYGGVGTNNRYLGDLWSYSTSAGWTLLQ